VFPRDSIRASRTGTSRSTCRAIQLDRMKHQATIRAFTITSDEPPSLGGDNEHPFPLDYFGAGMVT
jgi:hypothetical protein